MHTGCRAGLRMVLHIVTCSDGRIGGTSGNANCKGGECIPTGWSATSEWNEFSVGDVPSHMEPDMTHEGMTMDMTRRMAYTALSNRVRNGDEHNSVGIRRYNRRRRARLHIVACSHADRRDPCRRDDERD